MKGLEELVSLMCLTYPNSRGWVYFNFDLGTFVHAYLASSKKNNFSLNAGKRLDLFITEAWLGSQRNSL